MKFIKNIFHKHNYIPKQRVMIVGGCFDILHEGHLNFLKNAKEYCDYLIVLLEPDEKIKIMKGMTRPINNYKLRIKNLEKIRLVDKVILLPILATSEGYQKFIEETIASLLHCYIAKNGKVLNNETMKQSNNVIYFGITKNDKNVEKNKNIKNLGKKMKIEVIEVNNILPEHSTSKLILGF